MFKLLLKGYLATQAIKLLSSYRHLSVDFLRIEAAKSYLHGVRLARLLAIRLLLLGLLIGLICMGVLLFHVGLFILLPYSLETKALLGLLLGITYVIVGSIAVSISLKEKAWMDRSGATAMLKEATA
jgi:hypothetical protein